MPITTVFYVLMVLPALSKNPRDQMLYAFPSQQMCMEAGRQTAAKLRAFEPVWSCHKLTVQSWGNGDPAQVDFPDDY